MSFINTNPKHNNIHSNLKNIVKYLWFPETWTHLIQDCFTRGEILPLSTHMLDVVFKWKLNTGICLCRWNQQDLQHYIPAPGKGISEGGPYILWFRIAFAGYIFILSVSTFLKFYVMVTIVRSKSVKAFPFSPTWVSTKWKSLLSTYEYVGRLASLFLHNGISDASCFIGFNCNEDDFLGFQWTLWWFMTECRKSLVMQCSWSVNWWWSLITVITTRLETMTVLMFGPQKADLSFAK